MSCNSNNISGTSDTIRTDIFTPLTIGNKWIYKEKYMYSSGTAPSSINGSFYYDGFRQYQISYFTKTIISSTTINNIQSFIVRDSGSVFDSTTYYGYHLRYSKSYVDTTIIQNINYSVFDTIKLYGDSIKDGGYFFKRIDYPDSLKTMVSFNGNMSELVEDGIGYYLDNIGLIKYGYDRSGKGTHYYLDGILLEFNNVKLDSADIVSIIK
jgi:hypothetical protein